MINRVQELRRALEHRRGKRDQIVATIDELKRTVRDLNRQMLRHERALEIVKQVGLATQQQLEYHLAEQVSLAMEAIFDDPYRLVVHFQEKRGKTEAEIMFSRRALAFPPIGSAGGGAVDVAAFALRIAYWSMRQDRRVAPVLLLDEPFSQLKGEEANKRALTIVQEISHQLNVQIIMVSDERIPREDIIDNADRVYHVSQCSTGRSTTIQL